MVNVLVESKNKLGEGPVWDHRNEEFIWVDILDKTIHFFTETSNQTFKVDEEVSAIVPVSETKKYLIALKNGLAFFDREDRSIRYISDCESDICKNRFNDGKCDPQGRFWFGSMEQNAEANKGSLYTLDKNFNVTVSLTNLTISNGLAWSLNSKLLYFIDTATRRIQQFDFDLNSGQIRNQHTIITIPEKLGYPDGMCTDRDGMLWVAMWGASCITHWNPNNGQLINKIDIPAINVTSLCFGGKNLDTLYITSARVGLSPEELESYPLSGSIFTVKPLCPGTKVSLFQMI